MPNLLEAKAADIVRAMRDFVTRATTPLIERLEGLERKLAEIPAGERGADGAAGEKGDRGEPGSAGEKGMDGAEGARGADGTPGQKGDPGEIGPVGPQGDPGERGVQGEPGINGKDGHDGKDFDPELVKVAVAEAVKAIPVPRDGAAGKDADPATITAEVLKAVAALPAPKDGRDGESVHPDTVAVLVRDAVAKAAAEIPKPVDGRDGRDGAAGRDAADINPKPGIDLERSYTAGTWAKHAGGLWLARSATSGMDGWDCIVEGIAAIAAVKAGDVRDFELQVTTSTGKAMVLPFSVPALIDKGIFKAGDTYAAGDVTTWDGSMWIAQKETQDKPGTSDAWRLSVKRGRDGRDGLKGEKGERGAEGRAGKDLTQLGPDGSKW